jgi:hypothetical protein
MCLGSLLWGCSGDGDFKVAKVKGQVTHQGQPVANVLVQLIPKSTSEGGMSGKSAIGTTDASGNFELSTYQPGDGAIIGTHSVSVGSQDPEKSLPGQVPDGFTFEVTKGPNELRIDLVPGAGGADGPAGG